LKGYAVLGYTIGANKRAQENHNKSVFGQKVGTLRNRDEGADIKTS